MSLSYKIISSPGPEDVRIRDFVASVDNDFYPPIATRRDLADFVQSVYDSKGRYIVCYSNDNIVGIASVYLDHPSFITYYHYIAVNEEFRKKGVASTLFDHIHEVCRETGVQRAIIKTWSTNNASQRIFNRHGFFHVDTLEDDRSTGVHTYFFAKSFTDPNLKKPIKRLGIIGNERGALGHFAETFSSIPRSHNFEGASLPYMVMSDALPADPDDKMINEELAALARQLEQIGVSHLLVVDAYRYRHLDLATVKGNVEIVDMAGIISKMVNARNTKCMLVADDIPGALRSFDIANVRVPDGEQMERIKDIVAAIILGQESPGYYRREIADIALANGCGCLVLGSVELHTMFGVDKRYNGVEIFDPWMELAVIIHDSRMKGV